MTQIKASISKLANLSEEILDDLCNQSTVLKLDKKKILISEGDIAKSVYFIESGLLRVYTIIEGEEHTSQFFFERGWLTDYQSFLLQTPANCFIQALEPTIVWEVKRDLIYQFYDLHPQFERFGRYMAEQAYLGLQKRTKILAEQSPEVRYFTLMKERPKVLERVSLKYIASYIGIKAESLFRIRRRAMH